MSQTDQLIFLEDHNFCFRLSPEVPYTNTEVEDRLRFVEDQLYTNPHHGQFNRQDHLYTNEHYTTQE